MAATLPPSEAHCTTSLSTRVKPRAAAGRLAAVIPLPPDSSAPARKVARTPGNPAPPPPERPARAAASRADRRGERGANPAIYK